MYLLGFGNELVCTVPIFQEFRLGFIIKPNVHVFKIPGIEVINLTRHVQNVSNTVKKGKEFCYTCD